MPLTPKGREVMAAMKKEYGDKKGESVFYASQNKGTLKGVEKKNHSPARDVQAFNETFMENADVPQVGIVTGDPGTYSIPTATGMARGVQSFDPTGSPTVTTQTFSASPNSANPGGKSFTPAAVDKFSDGAV